MLLRDNSFQAKSNVDLPIVMSTNSQFRNLEAYKKEKCLKILSVKFINHCIEHRQIFLPWNYLYTIILQGKLRKREKKIKSQ